MHLTTPSVRNPRSAMASLAQNLSDVLVSPGEVFEEVVVSPPTFGHWLAPFLLVCLTGILSLVLQPAGEWRPAQVPQLAAPDASGSSDSGSPLHHDSELAIL